MNFIWLNELSFDQMLERVRTLPPHSFVFLVLFLRDAAGVTQNADEALQRLHAVANAPINSIFTSQMGLGIVGGRLYPSTEDGIRAAKVAVKILNGRAPRACRKRIVPPTPPQYDWRELQRWKIDEKHLPRGAGFSFDGRAYGSDIARGSFPASYCWWSRRCCCAFLRNLVKRRRAEHSFGGKRSAFPHRRRRRAGPDVDVGSG